jgi:hypothetical protein
MSAYYVDDSTFVAACFGGECGLSINFGANYTPFEQGQKVTLDLNTLEVTSSEAIPQGDKEKYWNLLNQTSAGRQDAGRCNVPNFAATQTAQAVAGTLVAQTRTAVAAATQTCRAFQQQFPGTPCP